MEELKINYYENSETKKYQEYIIAHNNCVLCGTVLELRHLANREELVVIEDAFCCQCDVKTRSKNYPLQ